MMMLLYLMCFAKLTVVESVGGAHDDVDVRSGGGELSKAVVLADEILPSRVQGSMPRKNLGGTGGHAKNYTHEGKGLHVDRLFRTRGSLSY